MLLVKLNGTDITAKVDLNTIKITEQMNNRANTCAFSVTDMIVPEAALIELWEGSELKYDATAGSPTIQVDETFEFFKKYRVGDELRIPAWQTGAIRRTIQSIDHTAGTITFTENLGTAYTERTKVGRLIFAGVTQKNPDQEIACGVFSYSLTATDWTKTFDQKNVVDTFLDQYPREVIGRVIHKFVATDSLLEVSDAETTTGWTYSGTAIAPTLETVDKLWKNAAISWGASWAGTVVYRFTPGAAINAATYTHLRTWTKIGNGQLVKLTNPKTRAFTSAWNYFEWSDAVQVEDCWNYDSFDFSTATKTGTPNQASIAYFEYQWTASTAVPADGILIDQITLTSWGFTMKEVMRGDTQYADIRAQFKKPTSLLEELAKLQQLYWYIDYEKGLHFFEQERYTCPLEILDSGEVYDNLSVTADTSQLKNRQVVRGGEAIDGSLYTQIEVTDGKMESWRLDYKPKDLAISISTNGGVSWIPKTVGVKNLHAAADYEYLFDFNEKVVERASDGILANGVLFRREYYPFRPIRVQVENAASILAMKALLWGDGIFDGPVINDASIRDFTEARARAKAEIAQYANPIISASWTSEQDGWKAGQIVHIQDTNRGIDASFLIQKLTRTQNTTGRWKYTVQAGSTMFGLIEFFQLLLKRSDRLMIDVSELVDVVKTIDETIILGDSWRFVKRGPPGYAHTNNQQYNGTITGIEGGTANDAYADFCEAA